MAIVDRPALSKLWKLSRRRQPQNSSDSGGSPNETEQRTQTTQSWYFNSIPQEYGIVYPTDTYENAALPLVAVIGPTGVGKSTFIKEITGNPDVGLGHTLHSETHAINTFDLRLGNGKRITLIDTPGFDDTFAADHDTLHTIAEWLSGTYGNSRHLSGILYMQQITQVRITGSSRRCVKLFEKLVGQENLQNVLLVTTFWNEVDHRLGMRREAELREESDFWKDLLLSGARTERMGRDYDRYKGILADMVGRQQASPIQIQREMQSGQNVSETTAGQYVNEESRKIADEFAQKAEDMQKAQEREIKRRDTEAALQRLDLEAGTIKATRDKYRATAKDKAQYERRIRQNEFEQGLARFKLKAEYRYEGGQLDSESQPGWGRCWAVRIGSACETKFEAAVRLSWFQITLAKESASLRKKKWRLQRQSKKIDKDCNDPQMQGKPKRRLIYINSVKRVGRAGTTPVRKLYRRVRPKKDDDFD